MDLGIKGKRALVCASSKGLGLACAWSLAREGADVVMAARTAATLDAAADAIRKDTGATIVTVAADVTTEAGRQALLAACPEPDILVTNAGGPKPGDFREWSREDWIAALDANMLTPIALIRATVDGMIARRFGRIVNITSAAVKMPIDILGLSNGARAGLTGFVAGLARQTVRHNVTINNLLPGIFDSDAQREHVKSIVKLTGRDYDEVWNARAKENPAGRYGDPQEAGDYIAFLCAAGSGFITAQNLMIDGGQYPGTY